MKLALALILSLMLPAAHSHDAQALQELEAKVDRQKRQFQRFKRKTMRDFNQTHNRLSGLEFKAEVAEEALFDLDANVADLTNDLVTYTNNVYMLNAGEFLNEQLQCSPGVVHRYGYSRQNADVVINLLMPDAEAGAPDDTPTKLLVRAINTGAAKRFLVIDVWCLIDG